MSHGVEPPTKNTYRICIRSQWTQPIMIGTAWRTDYWRTRLKSSEHIHIIYLLTPHLLHVNETHCLIYNLMIPTHVQSTIIHPTIDNTVMFHTPYNSLRRTKDYESRSREHLRQQLIPRQTPAIFPPTDPNARTTRHIHPLNETIEQNRTSPDAPPQRTEGHSAEHGERPRAGPTALRPYERALQSRIGVRRDGETGRCCWKRRGEASAQFDE